MRTLSATLGAIVSEKSGVKARDGADFRVEILEFRKTTTFTFFALTLHNASPRSWEYDGRTDEARGERGGGEISRAQIFDIAKFRKLLFRAHQTLKLAFLSCFRTNHFTPLHPNPNPTQLLQHVFRR